MARYRIKRLESCNAYFVMEKVLAEWHGIFSYAHKHWQGKELGLSIKAKQRLIKKNKEKKNEWNL